MFWLSKQWETNTTSPLRSCAGSHAAPRPAFRDGRHRMLRSFRRRLPDGSVLHRRPARAGPRCRAGPWVRASPYDADRSRRHDAPDPAGLRRLRLREARHRPGGRAVRARRRRRPPRVAPALARAPVEPADRVFRAARRAGRGARRGRASGPPVVSPRRARCSPGELGSTPRPGSPRPDGVSGGSCCAAPTSSTPGCSSSGTTAGRVSRGCWEA